MFGGEDILIEVEQVVRTIAPNLISGTYSQKLPIVETITINWGYDISAYLFVVAATLRIIGGLIVWTIPELR